MTLPNFLIIGAAKSGTTALTRFLHQHPQVHIPYKEPNFFSGWNSRIQFYIPPRPPHIEPEHQCATLDAYQALFVNSGDACAVGEASVSYLPNKTAPHNIKQLLPNVRLIVLLRHPVDRAFSQYIMSRHAKIEPMPDFLSAIQHEPERLQRNWLPFLCYLKLSHYPEQLARYQKLFPPEQFRIYLFDDWLARPNQIWVDILNFLEINHTYVPDFTKRHNENRLSTPMWDSIQAFHPLFKQMIPPKIRHKIYVWLRRNLTHRPILDQELRSELTEKNFRDDIFHLQDMLQRDLSSWF